MGAEWTDWKEHATQRRAAGASDASVMRELAQRGASTDEAEGVVRSLGARFDLTDEDRRELAL